MEDDALFLIGGRERFVLSGARTIEVAALVDGRRSVHDILCAARGRVCEPEALYTLSQLVARGYLACAASELPAERVAFWYGQGLDGKSAVQALRRGVGPSRWHGGPGGFDDRGARAGERARRQRGSRAGRRERRLPAARALLDQPPRAA
ncbi:hypothetical protein ACSRUE_00390 [Sorangium sp. KYC3313]|uniref:hypothetical protein n=1 Tax=Sorangium sp. KYC3313 TaxID=3449740 RepID=UPI003F89AE58